MSSTLPFDEIADIIESFEVEIEDGGPDASNICVPIDDTRKLIRHIQSQATAQAERIAQLETKPRCVDGMTPDGHVCVDWHKRYQETSARELKLSAELERAKSACNCNLRTRLVGDGCEKCNPEYAAQFKPTSAEVRKRKRPTANYAWNDTIRELEAEPATTIPLSGSGMDYCIKTGCCAATPAPSVSIPSCWPAGAHDNMQESVTTTSATSPAWAEAKPAQLPGEVVRYDNNGSPDEFGGWVLYSDHEAAVRALVAERDTYKMRYKNRPAREGGVGG